MRSHIDSYLQSPTRKRSTLTTGRVRLIMQYLSGLVSSEVEATGPWVFLHLHLSRSLWIGFKVHQETPSNRPRGMNPIRLREPQSDPTKSCRHWPSCGMLAESLHQGRMGPPLTGQEILQKRCCGERETAAVHTGHCKRSRRMPIFEESESPMAQKPSQQKQGDSLPLLCWYLVLPALSLRNQFQ